MGVTHGECVRMGFNRVVVGRAVCEAGNLIWGRAKEGCLVGGLPYRLATSVGMEERGTARFGVRSPSIVGF
jgi:hypothetical protein